MKWWPELLSISVGWILFYIFFINEKLSYKASSVVLFLFKILTSLPMFLVSICLSVDAWNDIRESELSLISKIIIFCTLLIVHIMWFRIKNILTENKIIKIPKEKVNSLREYMPDYCSNESNVEEAIDFYISHLSKKEDSPPQ